ncbi:MAG: AMP-binding protein [Bacteroidales bacterium]|nr:AMP-binding protein [Bacteroidales bacterium]
MLRNAANNFPGRGISYVSDDGSMVFHSYSELLSKAELFAAGLKSIGIKPGETIILATEFNQETIISLWGSFLAGIIPTVLQPPISFADQSQAAIKLLNVFRLLNQPVIILSKAISDENNDLHRCIKYYSDIDLNGKFEPVQLSSDDTAFIQFSSGSTGEPKGIKLTHKNLMYNMNSITLGLQFSHDENTGNWMPLYHDMGLIGYHLTPIYYTHNQFHIETIDFIKNPSLWLDLISNKRIRVTGCPNFGQALVLRHLKRKNRIPDWDFSSLRALLNGAEPISVKIMDEFVESLKKFGFPEEAMMPVYGMAEATLAISFSPIMESTVVHNFDIEELDLNKVAKTVGQNTNP